jgi:hypothetical protein
MKAAQMMQDEPMYPTADGLYINSPHFLGVIVDFWVDWTNMRTQVKRTQIENPNVLI